MSKRWFERYRLKDTLTERDDGQALVELALVMPFLFLVLLGAVEFSNLVYAGIEVSNSARAAVQYGAMNGGNTTDVNGMLAAAQNDSPNLGTNVAFTSGYPTVSYGCSDGSTYNATTYCRSAYVYATLSVKMQTKFSPIVQLPGFGPSFTLYGYAQELVLQ
jgi:Flp pilus assembly protein TadG